MSRRKRLSVSLSFPIVKCGWAFFSNQLVAVDVSFSEFYYNNMLSAGSPIDDTRRSRISIVSIQMVFVRSRRIFEKNDANHHSNQAVPVANRVFTFRVNTKGKGRKRCLDPFDARLSHVVYSVLPIYRTICLCRATIAIVSTLKHSIITRTRLFDRAEDETYRNFVSKLDP